MKEKNDLDQFYTNPKISDLLVEKVFSLFPSINSCHFIEPSAGTGNFLQSLLKKGIKKEKILAIDIAPLDGLDIIKSDYLTYKICNQNHNPSNFVTIGNPPFGNRGELALKFLNKSLTESYIVAFILPNLFQRYGMQSKVSSRAKLIYNEKIPQNSFLVDNREYNVNCVFQIWINEELETMGKNIRVTKPIHTKHEDFTTYIYNNTKTTLKYFNKEKYGWDIALYRQGFYDYNLIFYSPDELVQNKQYLFIKFKKPIAKEIIKSINLNKLAKKNSTIIPGYSLTDFVEEYNNKKIFFEAKNFLNKKNKN